ncbi:MAG TPA: sialidase family protein [Jiangellaceae bacterium]|nr:sialidase family protein [Jiangellaceae bacterium]
MRSRTVIGVLALLCAFTLGIAGTATAGSLSRGPLTVLSGPSPFAGCDTSGQAGTNFLDSEVEPWVDVNPTDPSNVIAVWQQDRWSNGGARGLVTAATHDGGLTWDTTFAHFSTCSGGTTANGGNYERASDPWVSFAPNGDAYQISLSVNLFNDPTTAILVSKSSDGGDTWSEPVTVARDPSAVAPFLFHDKESITADPTDSNFVYTVWDRTRFPSDRTNFNAQHAFSFRGDIMFARTTDAGVTWEPARAIFEPNKLQFTIGHQIVVRPNGDLFDFFTLFQGSGNNPPGASLAYVRSTDKGETWSEPQVIHKIRFIGAFDPDTGLPIRAEGFTPEVAVDPNNGNLYATWQDTRFSGVDEIAFSMSTDGGVSWSTPIKVNQTPPSADVGNEQAWVQAVHVAADGTIAASYYDFRNNTSAAGAPTDYWLVHCHPSGTTTCADAGDWGSELRLTDASFDIEQAPFARGPFGYFLGEYEGLASAGNTFWPLFAVVNDGDPANRTDIVVTTGS